MHIIIGSRGSQLALRQTDIIREQLLNINPDVHISIKVITTHGDINHNPIPVDTIGKGWFTKEIEKALIEGSIDMAVHSLKDLPEVLPPGLIIGAIPQREDAREVLISKTGTTLAHLKKSSIIGTDSLRRQSQVFHMRPDLLVKSIRGNVPTRLEKLYTQDYDGLILAAAGLKRLGLTDKITEHFGCEDFIPAPGQGALAIEIRSGDRKVSNLLKAINHQLTVAAVTAERTFSQSVGGGCKMPVGAYAQCINKKLRLIGMIGKPDGSHVVKETIDGPVSQSRRLGQELARRMKLL